MSEKMARNARSRTESDSASRAILMIPAAARVELHPARADHWEKRCSYPTLAQNLGWILGRQKPSPKGGPPSYAWCPRYPG